MNAYRKIQYLATAFAVGAALGAVYLALIWNFYP